MDRLTELRCLSDEDLQNLVYDYHYAAAEAEANAGDRDPDEVYTDAEFEAACLLSESKDTIFTWILHFEGRQKKA